MMAVQCNCIAFNFNFNLCNAIALIPICSFCTFQWKVFNVTMQLHWFQFVPTAFSIESFHFSMSQDGCAMQLHWFQFVPTALFNEKFSMSKEKSKDWSQQQETRNTFTTAWDRNFCLYLSNSGSSFLCLFYRYQSISSSLISLKR